MSTKRHTSNVMVNLLRLMGVSIAKGKTTLQAALKVTSSLATIQE